VQDVSGDIREAEIPAAITIRELKMIDTHQVEDDGVDIMHMDRFLNRLETEVIRGALDSPARNRPSGEPPW
jgi:hypothetical protein